MDTPPLDDVGKLRLLADWFDRRDMDNRIMDNEVQRDLRRIADEMLGGGSAVKRLESQLEAERAGRIAAIGAAIELWQAYSTTIDRDEYALWIQRFPWLGD